MSPEYDAWENPHLVCTTVTYAPSVAWVVEPKHEGVSLQLAVLAERLGMTSEEMNDWVWAPVPKRGVDGRPVGIKSHINNVSGRELSGNFVLSVPLGSCSFNAFEVCESLPGSRELTAVEVEQAFSEATRVVVLGSHWDALSPALPLAIGATALTILSVRAHAWIKRRFPD